MLNIGTACSCNQLLLLVKTAINLIIYKNTLLKEKMYVLME